MLRLIPWQVHPKYYIDVHAAAELGIGREVALVETSGESLKIHLDQEAKKVHASLGQGLLQMLMSKTFNVGRSKSSTNEASVVVDYGAFLTPLSFFSV